MALRNTIIALTTADLAARKGQDLLSGQPCCLQRVSVRRALDCLRREIEKRLWGDINEFIAFNARDATFETKVQLGLPLLFQSHIPFLSEDKKFSAIVDEVQKEVASYEIPVGEARILSRIKSLSLLLRQEIRHGLAHFWYEDLFTKSDGSRCGRKKLKKLLDSRTLTDQTIHDLWVYSVSDTPPSLGKKVILPRNESIEVWGGLSTIAADELQTLENRKIFDRDLRNILFKLKDVASEMLSSRNSCWNVNQ